MLYFCNFTDICTQSNFLESHNTMNPNPSTLWKLHKANTWPTHVSDNLRGNLLHFSLFPPIAYHHLPRWRCIHIGKKEEESDDSHYLYHPATGVDLQPPSSPPPHYVKVWITFGMHASRIQKCVFYACVRLTDFIASIWEEKGGSGLYTPRCMHVCIHAETPPPPPMLPLSSSIIHP